MTDDIPRPPIRTLLGVSFAVTLGAWLLFSWPLPRYVATGVPASAHRAPADVQNLIPGDHLQFMYYCWLAGDMVAGKTPPGCNLYEFNTGNDRERFEPDAYYVPFSLIYSAGAALGGRAFGWNITGFMSLWLTYLLTWLLARRWTRNEWMAAIAALPAILLPFRWISLFGGSPAGFAMAWIPAILLGVDAAVRNDRAWGGILAGAAILLAAWTDSHVFFFGTLAAPVWGIVAFAARADFHWRQGAAVRRLALAVLPIALFAAAALLFPVLMKGLYRVVTGMAPVAHAIGPRTMREVLLYSPDWRGFFGTSSLGISDHIYLGFWILLFLAAGWVALALGTWKDWRNRWRMLLAFTLLSAVILGIMNLALGARGLKHGAMLEFFRSAVPPYAMIRQPAKIFCLMPAFLAAASAMALTALVQLRKGKAWRVLVPAVFAALIVLGYARQSNPTISLLEKQQEAYAAVAADAAARGLTPRALVLPLWPGDSHYASIYQYFASLYHIRMINGYNPFIKQGYFENVFRRFESVNQGGLYDDQLARLLGMNVRYLILHEDLFPEKVSPFPVTSTLRQLLGNPRLEFLRQDGSVWAFKILDAPRPGPLPPAWNTLFPTRRFEMEKTIAERRVTVKINPAAGGRAYVALTETNASLKTAPIRVASVSNLYWLARVRGHGGLTGTLTAGERSTALAPIPVDADDWTWLNLPVPPFQGFTTLDLKLALAAGAVELDLSLLTAGPWRLLNPGESVTLPAPLFFHAGHIDLKSGRVVFRRDRDSQGIVFYGPKLPLPRGTYTVEIDFTSPAKPGTRVAIVNLEQRDAAESDVALPLYAGLPARGRWRHHENLPFNMVLVYEKHADLEIQSITFRRLK